MTQEEKELLLKDISARLRYGVKFKSEQDVNPIEIYYIKDEEVYTRQFKNLPYWIESIKPYLRPMSSMTEDEKSEYFLLKHRDNDREDNIVLIDEAAALIDWLNKNKFDYRGLIPMGIALKAPEDMYNN
jgi:hypothetical protein